MYLFISAAMMSQLLNQVGTTQTLPLINVLSRGFESSTAEQTRLVASIPLVSGSFILVSGKVGDIYGLKNTLLFGYATVIVWSFICGLTRYAGSVQFFVIARAFQGLGLAFVLPNVMGTVSNVYIAGSIRKNMVYAYTVAVSLNMALCVWALPWNIPTNVRGQAMLGYSMPMCLGIAGTVEHRVHKGGADRLGE